MRLEDTLAYSNAYNTLLWCNANMQNNVVIKVDTRRDKMTKSDLKNFMVVEFRDGKRYIVNTDRQELFGTSSWTSMSNFNEDLTSKCFKSSDIMYVYNPQSYQLLRFTHHDYPVKDVELVWERKAKPVEMTIAEIEEKLGIKNLKVVKEKN